MNNEESTKEKISVYKWYDTDTAEFRLRFFWGKTSTSNG